MDPILVIGAGAAGLTAAYAAASSGAPVTLLEKNREAGKKINITGKGRCNLTNDCTPQDFLQNVVRNPKFLSGAIYELSPEKTKDLFTSFGLELKTERGNRVFPLSDRAKDVTDALVSACKKAGVAVRFDCTVKEIKTSQSGGFLVTAGGSKLRASAVIVATGGVSYPATGSTGDGYSFAEKTGHTVLPARPALVGMELSKSTKEFHNLVLKNVALEARLAGQPFRREFGEMEFTPFGVGGPIVLTLSSYLSLEEGKELTLYLDLKPALSEKALDARLLRDFAERSTQPMKDALRKLLVKELVSPVLRQAGVSEEEKPATLPKEKRAALVSAVKNLALGKAVLRPVKEGIVTAGGVSVKEIDPKTMESKLCPGLYFAGEVLDVDALTGGYNLQIAFSTGYRAGNSAAKEILG